MVKWLGLYLGKKEARAQLSSNLLSFGTVFLALFKWLDKSKSDPISVKNWNFYCNVLKNFHKNSNFL